MKATTSNLLVSAYLRGRYGKQMTLSLLNDQKVNIEKVSHNQADIDALIERDMLAMNASAIIDFKGTNYFISIHADSVEEFEALQA